MSGVGGTGTPGLRLLNVISSGEEGGGAESHVALVNAILRERGHTVRTLASDLNTGAPRFDDQTFPAVPSHGLKKLVATSWNWQAAAVVNQELSTFRPDVVVVHTMQQVTPAVLYAIRNVPTVVCIHGPEYFIRSLLSWSLAPRDFASGNFGHDLTLQGRMHWAYFRLISDPLYRVALRSASRLVTFSTFMTSLMAAEGMKTTYLRMGVPLYPSAPLDLDDHTILYAGRLEAVKGVMVLAEAFKEVRKAVPDARLRIAGSGSAGADLRGRLESDGLVDCVDFLGHLAADSMAAFYASGSVLVLPSIFAEAFGKVGPEAMSVGRPVVASSVGGVLDWLRPDVNGLTFPVRDASTLARVLTSLFQDPALLAQLSRGALETAPEFAISGHVDQLEEMLTEVITEAGAKKIS